MHPERSAEDLRKIRRGPPRKKRTQELVAITINISVYVVMRRVESLLLLLLPLSAPQKTHERSAEDLRKTSSQDMNRGTHVKEMFNSACQVLGRFENCFLTWRMRGRFSEDSQKTFTEGMSRRTPSSHLQASRPSSQPTRRQANWQPVSQCANQPAGQHASQPASQRAHHAAGQPTPRDDQPHHESIPNQGEPCMEGLRRSPWRI